MYNGEIIHFIGGLTEYIGEMDQGQHPMGKGWYRIKNPAWVLTTSDGNDKLHTVVGRLGGPQHAYRKFVDIFIPEQSLIEIRVLEKDSDLYKFYLKEVNRPKSELIHLPGSSATHLGVS
jgi:hypothetical protein